MTLEPLPLWLINAFTTDTPHSGNQAGVVLFPRDDPRAADDEYKQRVAKDINYSETAYLVPLSPGKWNLRWFTPAAEVKLCGHATLASARVLFSVYPNLDKITFETRWSGELSAERISDDGNSTTIKIFLPTWSPETLEATSSSAKETTARLKGPMAKILKVDEEDVEEVVIFKTGFEGTVTRLKSSVDLKSLRPDIQAFPEYSPEMTLVTQADEAKSGKGRLAIKSRVFCPVFDVDEDPVTGSANSYVTSYWLKNNYGLVKTLVGDVPAEDITIDALQVSERGGKLELKLVGDGQVSLIGAASETAKGTLSVW